MIWYHFTGISGFNSILENEALLSHYERIRRDLHKKFGYEEGEKRFNIVIKVSKKDKSEDEFRRLSNVFLTSSKRREMGIRGNDIVLGFNLNIESNFGAFLIVPSLSLEHLIEIEAKQRYLKQVESLLRTSHNGKYQHIPVYPTILPYLLSS